MDDKSSDHGIVIKDSQHESVPGYFLKFASLNNPDPTKRPYLMVCQKKREYHGLCWELALQLFCPSQKG